MMLLLTKTDGERDFRMTTHVVTSLTSARLVSEPKQRVPTIAARCLEIGGMTSMSKW